jgi:tryptophan-rich sensory protein
VFFARRSPAGGVAVVLGLDALDVALLRATARHDRTATVALVPYALWTGFATALTCSIWRRNR